jgi:hypothetical protein
LLSELLQDVTKLDVQLGTAVCHVELTALKKLSSEERKTILKIFESRLTGITDTDQKEKVEIFLQQLTNAETPK